MASGFADLALKAAKENLSHEAYLFELARHEDELRTQRRTARLLRASGLPVEKTFRTFQWSRLSPQFQIRIERLKSGSFLESATNVIAVGKPGVGKSHLAAALGHELILAGHPVLWTPTSTLVQRLLAAKRDLRLPQELTKLEKFACVILDDIGYVQHDRDEMEVLFTFLSERYETRSVIITTNLVFSEWNHIFKNPMTTMAAIDRVIHHSYQSAFTDTSFLWVALHHTSLECCFSERGLVSVILDMMEVESYRALEANHHQQLTQVDAPKAGEIVVAGGPR